MEDLRNNKKLFKLMWVSDIDGAIWDAKNETQIPYNSKIFETINHFLPINDWANEYKKQYDLWLNEDDNRIYQLEFSLNKNSIESLLKINELLTEEKIFFWFDVDRTIYENFEWQICPLSQKPLIKLGEGFPTINQYISPVFPLIFPSIVQ